MRNYLEKASPYLELYILVVMGLIINNIYHKINIIISAYFSNFFLTNRISQNILKTSKIFFHEEQMNTIRYKLRKFLKPHNFGMQVNWTICHNSVDK